MANPLENNMLLYLLAGAGKAIAGPGSAGASIGSTVQGTIAAENQNKLSSHYLQMLSGMLKGGAKINFDKDNVNIKAPVAALSGQDGSVSGTAETVNPANPANPANASPTGQPINPSFGPLNSTDLVGLTPADMASALSGALGVSNFKAKMAADQAQLNAPAQEKKTSAIKNYEYALTKGYSGSFTDFQSAAKTTHQKDYVAAKAGGYKGSFNNWLQEMAKAGAINLGDIVARKAATSDISAQKYFTDPTGLSKDVDKYINSNEMQNKLFTISDPRKLAIATSRAKEKYIISKITASGGKVQNAKLEGKTFVWTVKWPNDSVSEVRYAN